MKSQGYQKISIILQNSGKINLFEFEISRTPENFIHSSEFQKVQGHQKISIILQNSGKINLFEFEISRTLENFNHSSEFQRVHNLKDHKIMHYLQKGQKIINVPKETEKLNCSYNSLLSFKGISTLVFS